MSKNIFTKSIFIKISVFVFLFLISISSFSFAQTAAIVAPKVTVTNFSEVGGLITNFNKNVIQNLVVLLGGVALVVFLWGMVLFIYHRQNAADSLKKDKEMMLWSLLALFVFVSVWGIIKLFQGFLGVSSTDMVLPKICTNGSCNQASDVPGGGLAANTPKDPFSDPTKKLSGAADCTISNVDGWPSTLDTSSTGAAVSQLQKCLKDQNYDLGTTGANKDGIDGSFGSKTETAIKDFQTKNKLTSDGKVGPSTRAVLLYKYMSAVPDTDIDGKYHISSWAKDISAGSTGDTVKYLQQFLLDNNCYANSNDQSNVDGTVGPNTLTAISNYQSVNALKEDKIVGPSTRAVMSSPDTSSCN
ncbi:MAG: peptidoglycan-binding protein [Candidatus Nomurabacteria bacterium]